MKAQVKEKILIKKIKVLSIFGTRLEAIKMMQLAKSLDKYNRYLQ
ncbi:hypothetical protein [Clostridium perfringens]